MIVRQNKYTNFSPYNKGFCSVNQNKSLLFTPPLRIEQGRHETGETSQPLPPASSASPYSLIRDSMNCRYERSGATDCSFHSTTRQKYNLGIHCGSLCDNNDTGATKCATLQIFANLDCLIPDKDDLDDAYRIGPKANSTLDSDNRYGEKDRLRLLVNLSVR